MGRMAIGAGRAYYAIAGAVLSIVDPGLWHQRSRQDHRRLTIPAGGYNVYSVADHSNGSTEDGNQSCGLLRHLFSFVDFAFVFRSQEIHKLSAKISNPTAEFRCPMPRHHNSHGAQKVV